MWKATKEHSSYERFIEDCAEDTAPWNHQLLMHRTRAASNGMTDFYEMLEGELVTAPFVSCAEQ